MATPITLMATPNRIQSSSTGQPLYLAKDVLDFDILDIQVDVVGHETPGATPALGVNIATGLQLDSSDGWLTVGSTALLTTPGTNAGFGTITLTGNFLRYVRWTISSWGSQSWTTLFIRGMARKYSDR